MSYCRFSSDDHRCDLYLYQSWTGDWCFHLATRRHKLSNDDLPPRVSWTDIEAWMAREKMVSNLVKEAELEKIDLPHAGESLRASSIEETMEILVYLRGLGYRFPDHVISQVRAEILGKDANARVKHRRFYPSQVVRRLSGRAPYLLTPRLMDVLDFAISRPQDWSVNLDQNGKYAQGTKERLKSSSPGARLLVVSTHCI